MGSLVESSWRRRDRPGGRDAPRGSRPGRLEPLLRPSDRAALEEAALLRLVLDLGASARDGGSWSASRIPDLVTFEPILAHLLDLAPRSVPRLAASCRAARAYFDDATVDRAACGARSSVAYARWPPLGRLAACAHRASLEAALPRAYHGHLRLELRDGATAAALDLFGSYVLAAGAAAIAGAILDGADLRKINLRGCGLGDDGAALVAVALADPASPIEALCLWSNDITDVGCANIAEALRLNSMLTSLDLSGNLIGEDGAAALADALALNGTLQAVDLRNNEVDTCDPRRRRRVGRRRRARAAGKSP